MSGTHSEALPYPTKTILLTEKLPASVVNGFCAVCKILVKAGGQDGSNNLAGQGTVRGPPHTTQEEGGRLGYEHAVVMRSLCKNCCLPQLQILFESLGGGWTGQSDGGR